MSKRIKKSAADEALGWASWLTLLVGMIFVLAACGPSTAPQPTATATVPEQAGSEKVNPAPNSALPVDESAYPPPAEPPMVEEAYPIEQLPLPSPTPVPGSYPAAEEMFTEPRFRLDLPLNVQDRVVNGQAPANLALAVVDVSSGGGVLGVGASDADGRFTIGVRGLPDGHRVGITFSELQPGKTHAEMSQEYFPHRGEGFMNIPNVGIFFDTALVES